MNDYYVDTYKEILEFLRKKGTKVAMQTISDGPFIYAEKRDFIGFIKKRGYDGPADYDGNPQKWLVSNDVLHVDVGTL